ncbi:MAG TPA: SRPBCC family protein [Anaeromyxobacteraceae bacterium]|nr:SRPBCC family protein [Anaeromyxobacteraceae bacterium]
MAEVSQEVVIDAPIDRVYDVIVDYARYPEFVPGIRACRVVSTTPEKRVEYELDLGVKRLRYTLRHVEERPRKVSWSLVDGELMKVSSGSWELTAEGEKTRARYAVEVRIAKPPLVPQAVVDRMSDELNRVALPRNLAAFKTRAERG